MSNKTAVLYTRIEPNIKEQTEQILDKVGLSMSDAINLFCRQVIIYNGLPFEVKAEAPAHLDATNWSKEKLAQEVEKGAADVRASKTHPAKEVFDRLKRGL